MRVKTAGCYTCPACSGYLCLGQWNSTLAVWSTSSPGWHGETLTGTWHPSVTGLVVNYDGEDRFAHAHEIESLSYEAARLTRRPEGPRPVRTAVRGGPVGQATSAPGT